jgi:hypothetical protein
MGEYCGWLFIDNIPLIYDKKSVARQLQVETWLELAQIVKELKIQDVSLLRQLPQPPYIV